MRNILKFFLHIKISKSFPVVEAHLFSGLCTEVLHLMCLKEFIAYGNNLFFDGETITVDN
jgi:hypothetical protein